MRWLLVAFALLAFASGARAQEPGLPEQPFWVCTRFPATSPTTVTADVTEVAIGGGTQLANNLATVRITMDTVDTDVFCANLDSVTGFAPDCAKKTYVVRFTPDAANCASGSDPSACPEEVATSGGQICRGSGTEPTVVYTSVPIPSRGITAAVISKGNPSYIKHEVKLDTATVAFTFYEVFYYLPSGLVEKRLRSLSPPSP